MPLSNDRLIVQPEMDPKEAFQACQREWTRASVDKKHPFRFLILSTIAVGEPRSRYVVLRKYDSNRFFLFTDARSEKVEELRKNPKASLLFYHPKKGLQTRVRVDILIHHQNEIAEELWTTVQGHGQLAYGSKLAPGSIIDSYQEAFDWPEKITDEHFAVIEASAIELDILQLNRSEHLRFRARLHQGEWQVERCTP